MSWQEAVTDVAYELADWATREKTDPTICWAYLLNSYAQKLQLIVKAAENTPALAAVTPRAAVDTLQASRTLQKLAEAEELRSSAQAMRLCVDGNLDGTYVPSAGVVLGQPVKSPVTGEWYVLKEDGLMHFCKEGPKACP